MDEENAYMLKFKAFAVPDRIKSDDGKWVASKVEVSELSRVSKRLFDEAL